MSRQAKNTQTKKGATVPPPKEWTLMFYFASDGPLAPGVVSQLKAIKEAGYQQDANVVVRFDPHTTLTPTHVFDVNLINKLNNYPHSDVGFDDNDPFIRNLVEDKLWGDEILRGRIIRDEIKKRLDPTLPNGVEYDPPKPPPVIRLASTAAAKSPDECLQVSGESTLIKEPSPYASLSSFLKFCCDEYPAKHYILFILGHGQVVGNDIFLFDEHADCANSLTLIQLGNILKGFRKCIKKRGSELELISFHSCSQSGLEVAYELKDTANFMLASQGPAFVGSWPYRQILIRIFNDIETSKKDEEPIDIKTMLTKIFDYCLYNSFDFQLAGYSFDVCLSDLRQVSDDKTPSARASLNKLAAALIAGLKDQLARQLILLAHWDAQSYWQESYIDLFDFCFRLNRRCAKHVETAPQATARILKNIMAACRTMGRVFRRGVYGDDDKLIVRCKFAGPAYQYSHGLSIYFPWSRPTDEKLWEEQYGNYSLIKGADATATNRVSWKTFLDKYFEKTMRDTHAYELGNPEPQDLEEPPLPRQTADAKLLEDIIELTFNQAGLLKGGSGYTLGPAGSRDPVGDDCDCPSIKNHPRSTRATSPNFFDDLKIL
jgi:hypothetical protein